MGVFVIERPRKEAMECINLCNRTQAMERGHVVHMIARRMGKEGMGCVDACVLTQGGRKKRVRMFASEGGKWVWCVQAEKGGRRFVTFLAHFLIDFACGKMAGGCQLQSCDVAHCDTVTVAGHLSLWITLTGPQELLELRGLVISPFLQHRRNSEQLLNE